MFGFKLLKSDDGQLAVEYMFIVILSLLIILTFLLPLTCEIMDYTLDISKSIKNKVILTDIANSIDRVSSSGSGSRKILYLDDCDDSVISINTFTDSKGVERSSLSTDLLLSDNNIKKITVKTKNKINSSLIYLKKGENGLLIEKSFYDEIIISNIY